MRRTPKICLAAVTSALLLSSGVAMAAGAADGLVAKKNAVVGNLHKKATRALVNAAQDEGYIAFLAATPAERHELKHRVDKVSLNVQSKFNVAEMCLIDASGPELARIVGQEVADDLSADESGAVFFKPGFATSPRQGYISPIYMSPDAARWVVAYVTPVVVNGENKAILHYEHSLDTFQSALNQGVKADEWVMAVSGEQYVISDSRQEIAIDQIDDKEEQSAYFRPFSFAGMDMAGVKAAIDAGKTLQHEGKTYQGAYKQSEHWTLFAFK